jgi:hypothetical protein
VRVVLTALALLAMGAEGAADGCRPCAFAGFCGSIPCGPTEARCAPRRGVVALRAGADDATYWALDFRRARRGRLVGRLRLTVPAGGAPPAVPGAPGRCRGGTCTARVGRLEAVVLGDRLVATARHRSGATCALGVDLHRGRVSDPPDAWVCRGPSGVTTSEGPVALDVVRLVGCAR